MGGWGPKSDRERDHAKNSHGPVGRSILCMILPGSGYSVCSPSFSVKWKQLFHMTVER